VTAAMMKASAVGKHNQTNNTGQNTKIICFECS